MSLWIKCVKFSERAFKNSLSASHNFIFPLNGSVAPPSGCQCETRPFYITLRVKMCLQRVFATLTFESAGKTTKNSAQDKERWGKITFPSTSGWKSRWEILMLLAINHENILIIFQFYRFNLKVCHLLWNLFCKGPNIIFLYEVEIKSLYCLKNLFYKAW